MCLDNLRVGLALPSLGRFAETDELQPDKTSSLYRIVTARQKTHPWGPYHPTRHSPGCDDATNVNLRDLPLSEYRMTVVIELYRVRFCDCGPKAEKVPLLPTKAPFSQRFEEVVGTSL
jgi:hypothetical protein